MRTRLADIDVGYTRTGEGPSAVMLHGLAEDRNSWADVQRRLSDFTTYAYDLRGHGETGLGEAEGTLQQLGGDLIAFLEALTGPADCIGYSLGGAVVLWVAARRPDLVTRATVAGTSTVVGRRAAGFFRDRIETIRSDFSGFGSVLKEDTRQQLVVAGDRLEEVTARRLEAIGTGDGYVNAARAMAQLNEDPLTQVLPEIACPVHVIGGEADVFCPRKAAEIMIAALRHGTYHEVARGRASDERRSTRGLCAGHSQRTRKQRLMVKRFGISRGVSPRETFGQVGEIARKAEELGFEALWFIDHQLGMKDVYAAMNVAAMETGSIEIGCAVTNLRTRHPTVTANATTALDELSDGRALLGLGAGWVAVHSIGEKPNRIAELREGIELFRELFSGEEIDFAGAKGRLATARRQIPIYLAVSQPRMLELSGELCDGAVLMGAADPDFCNWQLEHIYRGLRKAGRKREDILIDLIVTMSIDEDAEQAVQDVRAWATSQAATFAVWKAMPPGWERFRSEFKAAEDAYHYEEHLSLRAGHKEIVSEEFVRSVTISGDRDHCLSRLHELSTVDIDRISFALLSRGRMRRLEELGKHVIPRLKAD